MLDVGTGSGYQAAVLDELAALGRLDRAHPELAEAGARAASPRPATATSRCSSATGRSALPRVRPFDAIAVAAAVPEVPPSLLGQLAERGRVVLPLGGRRGQRLTLVGRSPSDPGSAPSGWFDVRFVPLPSASPKVARVASRVSASRPRAVVALPRPHNWIQLAKFSSSERPVTSSTSWSTRRCSGSGAHYQAAAVSFVVSAANNYVWNRALDLRAPARALRLPGDALLRRRLRRAAREPVLAGDLPRRARAGKARRRRRSRSCSSCR